MDNPSRSERTRKAALQAALTIIARDGPGRLTLDAIAKEAGISKGGLMHQFPSKQAVLKALLEQQVEYFEKFHARRMTDAKTEHPELAAQIATFREAAMQPHSIASAFLGAVAEEPSLLSISRERDAERIAALKAEAGDSDLALLRRSAAEGLALSSIFGLSAMSRQDQMRLFDRLMDDAQWTAVAKGAKRPALAPKAAAKRRTR
jgi:AcrR family transcriptional regulator